jgi:hypothetical protein
MDGASTLETEMDGKAQDAQSAVVPEAPANDAGVTGTPAEENATGGTAAPGDAGQEPGTGSTVAVTLKTGATDPNGNEVTCIYANTDRYIIYLTGDRVRFVLPGNYEVAKALRKKIAGLGGLRASIDDLRSETSIGPLDRTRSARELAWALGEAFEDDSQPPSDQPKQALIRVDDRLRSLINSHYRKNYVLANFIAFVIIVAVFAIIEIALYYIGRKWAGPEIAVPLPLSHYAYFGMLGALGAFLSVISGIRSIEFNVDLGRWEHLFAGATRILIGVIGAWVVGLALDSALIDPTFGHHAQPDGQAANTLIGFPARDAMYFILTFIGGFSETLVPNLLRRGEDAAGLGAKSGVSTDSPIVNT